MLKLKSLITEQEQFKAKSKETGRTIVYKSKDAMDKAIKGGTAEPLDKKTSGKPEKVKGADLFKKDKPKSDKPKSLFSQVSDENKDEFVDVVSDIDSNSGLDTIDVDKSMGGSGTYYNNIALPALKEKFPEGGDEFYEGLNGGIDSAIESLDYIQDKKLKEKLENELNQISDDMQEELGEEYQDAVDGFGKLPYKKMLPYMSRLQDFKNKYLSKPSKDKIELGTKVKDGKIKSSGPQQFADDVKDMKGEYELNGVKIKDGKMFDSDGEEMDADDIEDFYYQDAYDGKGINVGIDIKKISEVYLKKSLDLLNEAQVWERKFGEPLPTLDSVMKKHSGKKIDEQGVLSRRAGINVFGDKKLELMSKNLRQTAFDLEKVAKKKDEKAFDDILQRITITIGVMRSFLNKPKRSM